MKESARRNRKVITTTRENNSLIREGSLRYALCAMRYAIFLTEGDFDYDREACYFQRHSWEGEGF